MKIACVVGARPNFIKMAPILKELSRHPTRFHPVLVHTGQHYDAKMSDVFFRDLDLPAPDHYLGVGAGTQAQQTGAIIAMFNDLCDRVKFDRVLVVGDVTSTFACAVSAAKRGIPVDHVEAGLRSFDRTMPEEINRILTDAIADLFFVSEPAGVANLVHEGHDREKIKLVGNVMIDSLLAHLDKARALGKWRSFNLFQSAYALVTLHRPSNVDAADRLQEIVTSLARVSQRIPVVFPVHPRTRKNLNEVVACPSLVLSEPLGYLEFLSLMAGSRLVVTDSGGIQEETTALGIPCLTLRHNTERPITVQEGTNTLLGDDLGKLSALVAEIAQGNYKAGAVPHLWDGHASRRIADILMQTRAC
jgi:UDP-N-acetylglucosamine 2-epimerase (non-hydrolysing)